MDSPIRGIRGQSMKRCKRCLEKVIERFDYAKYKYYHKNLLTLVAERCLFNGQSSDADVYDSSI